MNDPREILARILAQADAATEGPWEADGMEGTIVRTVVPDRPAQDCLYLGGTPHTGGIVQLGMLTAALDCAHDYEEDDQ